MSYPVFSPTLTSQPVTNDSWRKIRTKETWAASSSPSVLFRKIRQLIFPLDCVSPVLSYIAWWAGNRVRAGSQSRLNLRLHIPMQTIIHTTISHKQRPAGSFFAEQHLSPCYPPLLNTCRFLLPPQQPGVPSTTSILPSEPTGLCRNYIQLHNVEYSFISQQIFIDSCSLAEIMKYTLTINIW